jgi:hypothetical protein
VKKFLSMNPATRNREGALSNGCHLPADVPPRGRYYYYSLFVSVQSLACMFESGKGGGVPYRSVPDELAALENSLIRMFSTRPKGCQTIEPGATAINCIRPSPLNKWERALHSVAHRVDHRDAYHGERSFEEEREHSLVPKHFPGPRAIISTSSQRLTQLSAKYGDMGHGQRPASTVRLFGEHAQHPIEANIDTRLDQQSNSVRTST